MYSSRIPVTNSNPSYQVQQANGFDVELIILLLVLLVLIRERADTKLILAIVYIMM